MCPKTRRLIKVIKEEEEKTKNMFNLMLGDDLQGRKDFISNFGAKYFEFICLMEKFYIEE